MSRIHHYKCKACGETFNDPIELPEFVDDSQIAAFTTGQCPYCMSTNLEEGIFGDEEKEEDENND